MRLTTLGHNINGRVDNGLYGHFKSTGDIK